jgi:hypothetical protein
VFSLIICNSQKPATPAPLGVPHLSSGLNSIEFVIHLDLKKIEVFEGNTDESIYYKFFN